MDDSYQITGVCRSKTLLNGFDQNKNTLVEDTDDSYNNNNGIKCNTTNFFQVDSLSDQIKNFFLVIGRSNETYSSGIRGVKERLFRKKTLYKRVPILNWLSRYSKQDAIGDFIAGLTVGMMIIPQSMAFAGIAGLDPHVRPIFIIVLVPFTT